MAKELPSVNFDNSPGFSEFKFLHQVYSAEISTRSAIQSRPGIVDFSGNPARAPFTAERAMTVQVSATNPLTIDIGAGIAVTENYALINIDAVIPSVPLPDITADKVYFVAVEYKLIASQETRLNRFQVPAEVRLERPSNQPYGNAPSTLSQAVTIDTLTNFNNLALYSEERKLDMVVIAIVTAKSDATTGQLSLLVDLTQNTYEFNRPWFSPIDIDHRLKVGSGVVSDRNPHGTELQDLSSAGFTLYQQLTPRGGVIAKDTALFGYPGTFCSELVTVNRFESDVTGTVTTPEGEQPLAGRYYVRLQKLPIRPGSLYVQGKPWEPIPYAWVPCTRIIVLGSLEDPLTYTAPLIIEYFSVQALEVATENSAQGIQSIEVTQPLDQREFIVSNGLAINTLAQTSVALSSALGVIKRAYQVLCDETGALQFNPQPLNPFIRITDVIGGRPPVAINAAPFAGNAVRLTIGLTRALESLPTPGFTLNLKLRLAGIDDQDRPITEDLVFRASQWRDQGVANTEEPMQVIQTTNKFSFVTSLTSFNTTSDPDNAGGDAIISLWANILESSDNQELAQVASFFWDGTKGIRVRDERGISTSLQTLDQRQRRFPNAQPELDASLAEELFGVLLDPPLTDLSRKSLRVAVELDNDRVFSETWKDFTTLVSSGSIAVLAAAATVGQTLRVAPGKFLKFVNPSLTLDLSKGEVALSSSNPILRNNLIATLNDPSFDSSWFAQLGSGNEPPVNLSRAQAYPEGFVLSRRKQLAVSVAFTTGTFEVAINGGFLPLGNNAITTVSGSAFVQVSCLRPHGLLVGQNVTLGNLEAVGGFAAVALNQQFLVTGVGSPRLFTVQLPSPASANAIGGGQFGAFSATVRVVSTGTHDSTFQTLADTINAATVRTDVSAVVITPTSGLKYLMLNGLPDAQDFTVLGAASTGGAPTAFITTPPEAFQFTQPTGGTLPTPHLPDRFLSKHKAWHYLSRPLLWSNVVLQAQIGFLGGSPATASNFDQIEVVPGKVITARRGVTTINPSAGEFLVDPASLANTLQAMVETINNAQFASGVLASVSLDGTKVLLSIAGRSLSRIVLLIEAVANTWDIVSYTAIGPGDSEAHAFLKALAPLPTAEWRYQTTDAPGIWAPWARMTAISPTAARLDGPPGKSLYCIQLRLTGEPGKPNGFSLYRVSPQIAGTTLPAIDTRLLTVEATLVGATANTASLHTRLSVVVDSNGVAVKDAELVAARSSIMSGALPTVRERLDLQDGLQYWLTGGAQNFANPTAMHLPSAPNAILDGPKTDGNAAFMTGITPLLNVGGTTSSPLVLRCAGNTYRYARQLPIDFTLLAPATYYVAVDLSVGNELGVIVASGNFTTTAASGATQIDVAPTNVGTLQIASILGAAKTPLVLVIPSILVGGQPFFCPIVGTVSTTQLQLAGRLPQSVTPGTAYQIRSFRELPFFVETTRVESPTKLYLGQVIWSGSSLDVRNYRYLDQYTSTQVQVTGNYTATFEHNLGKLPRAFTVYFYETALDTDPKVLSIGDECVVKSSPTTLTVKNRYDGIVARRFSALGTTLTTGFIRIVI